MCRYVRMCSELMSLLHVSIVHFFTFNVQFYIHEFRVM